MSPIASTSTPRRIGSWLALALVAPLALAVGGCSSDSAGPSPAETSAATEASEASASAEVDRTAELQAVAGDVVVEATETEPGRFEVLTSLVDPRDAEGSADAQEAISVCEAAVGLGATYVSVAEEDGTAFVLYGHPSVGEICTEV